MAASWSSERTWLGWWTSFSTGIASPPTGARWIDELTAKERQVLALLTIGHTVEDVARHLSISVGTARNHVHRILKKTRTTSAIEAIAMARHYGFVLR